MPIGVRYDDGGLSRKVRSLRQGQGFKRGKKAALLYFRSKIAPYPPVSRRPAEWDSYFAMIEFFRKLSAGEITVPYQRGVSPESERLAQQWQIDEQGSDTVLSNNASYAGLVQGRQQIGYHKRTGWKTVNTVIHDESPEMIRIIVTEMIRG